MFTIRTKPTFIEPAVFDGGMQYHYTKKEIPMFYNIPKLQHLSERVWVNPAAVAGVKTVFGEDTSLVDVVLDPSFKPSGVAFVDVGDGEFVKVSTLAAVVWEEDFDKGARVSFVNPGTTETKEAMLSRAKTNEIVELYNNEILQAVELGDEDDDWAALEDDDYDEDTDEDEEGDEDGDYDDPFAVDDDNDGESREHPFDEV